ncbi:MAG: alpha/beta hydrolase [Anaerolineales bacterium]|jgi:pimeloyl-ACP methyl ester carboxylesterase
MTQTEQSKIRKKSGASALATSAQALAGAALGAATSWILYSNLAIDHDVGLPKGIAADRDVFFSDHAGKISYYVDREGSGGPLVLIHSVNAAASAYEMRPLFEHYRLQRPVFALDLPGYGFSERSPRVYTPELFAEAILDLLKTQVGEPADVMALSLGCEFAARAAVARPELFKSLTLISPSGFTSWDEGRASQRAGEAGGSDTFYSLISFGLWRRPLYDLIVTRRSIEYFLGQSFVGRIPAGMVDYAYATAHQPGAEYVPVYFLSGKLFTPNAVETLYNDVEIPVLVIYDQDAFVRFDRLPGLLERKDNWRAERIRPTLGLPHFEKLPEMTQTLEGFWESLH